MEVSKLYITGMFSMKEITRAYRSVSRTTIRSALVRQGTAIRSRSEVKRISWEKGAYGFQRKFTDEEEAQIAAIYTVGKFNITQIIEKYGCGRTVIRDALRRQGKNLRTPSEAQLLRATVPLIRGGSKYPGIHIGRLNGLAHKLAMRMARQSSGQQIALHRLIMALHLRRPLFSHEVVHHRER